MRYFFFSFFDLIIKILTSLSNLLLKFFYLLFKSYSLPLTLLIQFEIILHILFIYNIQIINFNSKTHKIIFIFSKIVRILILNNYLFLLFLIMLLSHHHILTIYYIFILSLLYNVLNIHYLIYDL